MLGTDKGSSSMDSTGSHVKRFELGNSTTSSYGAEVLPGDGESGLSVGTHASSKDLEKQESETESDDIAMDLDFLGNGFSFGRPKHW